MMDQKRQVLDHDKAAMKRIFAAGAVLLTVGILTSLQIMHVSFITVSGGSRDDWSVNFCAQGEGQSEAETTSPLVSQLAALTWEVLNAIATRGSDAGEAAFRKRDAEGKAS